MPFAPSSYLLLVVRPGAPSSVPASSSDALCRLHMGVVQNTFSQKLPLRRTRAGLKATFVEMSFRVYDNL